VLAYHTSIDPPERVKLDRRILLDFCPIDQSFEKQIDDPANPRNAGYAANLRAWRKAFDGEISVYSYYRKYAWRSLPVLIPGYIQRDLTWYGTQPVQGISSYAEPGDWGAYELNHYVLGHLAWNPRVSVEAVVGPFCSARFGAAAGPARAAMERLGDLARTYGSIPNTSLKSVEEIRGARGELDAQGDAIRRAAAAATGPHASALKRLGLAIEYARRDLEIQEQRAAKTTDAARAKVRELAEFLAAHKDDGVFLVHARLDPQRLLQSYGLAPRRPVN
jgi:hypothetical protein